MTTVFQYKPWCIAITLLSMLSTYAYAGGYKNITLIEMGDLHGTLVSHAAVLKNPDGTERFSSSSGGLARLKTVVDRIRMDNPDSVLLSCGDLTHGSAEALFTVGDAMIKAMNEFGIDVFTPGNWDFGYGPAVFRHRFASKPPFPPVPPNIQVMAGYENCAGSSNCTESGGIIQANFPSVAINLYNAAPIPEPALSKRVLDPYRIIDRNGVKIAVIGITAAIVPQQADVFNIGLRFTQGVEELPEIIEQVKAEGADLIVVQSELGMSQNIRIAQSFDDIDVMYSAHTHEVTTGALIADADGVTRTDPDLPLSGSEVNRLARGATIVVETNRDMYVGRLDLKVGGSKVIDFTWAAIPVDETVPENKAMADLVASIEEPFIAGDDGEVMRHTFMPGAFCAPGPNGCGEIGQRGHQLVDDLDTIVGHTDTLLLRHHVLEDTLNNFLADAIRSVSDDVVVGSGVNGWTGVDLSMSNGFRFGNAVLPDSDITLRDLYTWYPIGPAVNVADFSGQALEKSLNEILAAVFDRNPFQQRGGWYLGLANTDQLVDLDNRPFSSSGGRIVETKIGGAPLDGSKRYVFASCYAQGDAIDQVCRTGGGANHMFFELADADDYNSTMLLVPPAVPPNPAALVKRYAPFRFVHPVHMVRRYLDDNGEVTEAQFGVGRIMTVDSTRAGNPPVAAPIPEPDPTFVQPPQGAGPKFLSGGIGHDH